MEPAAMARVTGCLLPDVGSRMPVPGCRSRGTRLPVAECPLPVPGRGCRFPVPSSMTAFDPALPRHRSNPAGGLTQTGKSGGAAAYRARYPRFSCLRWGFLTPAARMGLSVRLPGMSCLPKRKSAPDHDSPGPISCRVSYAIRSAIRRCGRAPRASRAGRRHSAQRRGCHRGTRSRGCSGVR